MHIIGWYVLQSQTLYWVDASLDKVESAGYDGSNRQLLASSGPGVYHPFSITFFEGTLYWTDWQVSRQCISACIAYVLMRHDI